MRNRPPVGLKRTPSGRGVGSPWAGLSAGRVVLTVTDNGVEGARVTTAAPHGLTTGQRVVLSGASVSAYNGTSDTVTVIDTVSFDFDGLGYSADAAGGVWTRV